MPASNYFVEIQGDLIPVPDIERASYSDDPECSAPPYLVVWMKPQSVQVLSVTPKYEYWGEHAEQGVAALRAVQLPGTASSGMVEDQLERHTRTMHEAMRQREITDKADLKAHLLAEVAAVGGQLQQILVDAEPDYCPGTKNGQHEWSDPAQNTVVSCKACGKIQP